MINELLLATILSTSFSVRTPNDDTKPLDYEYSIRGEKTEGNFTYNAKRDWERELGNKYIDDVIKFNQNVGIVYGGLDYINKQSKDINYTTYNLGLKHKSGLKIGLSVKDDVPLLNVGVNIDDKTPLTKISYQQKLKIIQGTGNNISFKVPKGMSRNFWQVFSKGKIKSGKNGEGNKVYFLPGKFIDSPHYSSEKELVNNVLWDKMEEIRRFN